jgi:hypothetical protein
MRTALLGGASRFAQFAGLTRGGRRADDGDDTDDKKDAKGSRADDGDDEDDQPKGKRSRADDGDDTDDKKDAKGSRAADGDDEDDQPKGKKSRADDGDDDEDDQPKGKKSKRSADDDDQSCEDDDDKDEMSGRSAAANARRRERARCAAILGHSAAAANVDLACSLAFETTMTRKEAVAVLKSQVGRAAPDTGSSRSEERAARNPDIGSGASAPAGGQKALDAGWDRAIAKVVPANRK